MTEILSSKQVLRSICQSFKAPIEYCFGYGSGVFNQGVKSQTRSRQIDMVFGVQNAKEWHKTNIQQNPHHYSFLKYFGCSFVGYIQNNFGAGLYYNPFTEIQGHTVKYGVVELNTLNQDLSQWKTLYLAGRLHKPVVTVKTNIEVEQMQKANLLSAMSTALLLLPNIGSTASTDVTSEHAEQNTFTELDLYMKIASISYMGDVRMAFAEHPKKIFNIVDNQFSLFRDLYTPLYNETGVHVVKDDGIRTLLKLKPNNELIMNLPLSIRALILSNGGKEVLPLQVSKAVAEVVRKSSFTQSFKGLLTAGPRRSLAYGVHKLQKRYFS